MKFFIDSVSLDDISALYALGLVDGVTTNPSLAAKAGKPFKPLLKDICALVPGPVSAEVAALDAPGMLAEAKVLSAIAANIVIKLPLTPEGLKACRALSADGIKTNVTLCFSANQALLAAKAGATFISPFIGRLDDIGIEGMDLIQDIRLIYDNYGFTTDILAASIRSPAHVRAAALAGADTATVPAAILRQLFHHPLTDKGIDQFMADWKASGLTIL
ncbi:MAG: fructose-6-phosphate aldolase [Hyphomicrobiales bacterium]|nr:fructose-6-phosphate aldolase [Hyphomicrobiales bacterium]OQW82877.1 MAG: fructose-6-phosphate aldolase [Proteobacteria bacterium ST_bin15]